jgi:hypothetical protein
VVKATATAISSLYFTGIAPSATAAIKCPKRLHHVRGEGIHFLQPRELLFYI